MNNKKPQSNNDVKQKTIVYPNGRVVKRQLKEHEVDLGERGIYSNKNKLNDLTGKEWTYFINSVYKTDYINKTNDSPELLAYLYDSVIETRYPSNGIESYGHKIRKEHPSPKPPQLMRDIIAFFTKDNGWILDPFAGVGGTLLGASLLENRHAVGIELDNKYIELYREVCKAINIKEQLAICGDAREFLKIDEACKNTYDLILTDPPYANMLSRKRTGGDRKDKGSFTDDPRDLGNITYEAFFPELRHIVEDTLFALKRGGYFVIFCKDLQPTKDYHNMIHVDIVSELSKIEQLQFKGYKIWYDKSISLYPYGYPYSYVSNQLHQYILIFRKEI